MHGTQSCDTSGISSPATKKGCQPVLALLVRFINANVAQVAYGFFVLSIQSSTLIALVFLGYRLFDPKVLYWGNLTLEWVWMQEWSRGKYWFISLMTEVGYPILYYFNLILGDSFHFAVDANHKSSRVFVIFSKVLELGAGHQPCFRTLMLKPLLQLFHTTKRLYMGYGRSRGFCRCGLAWRVALKALLEPKSGLPIESLEDVWMALW